MQIILFFIQARLNVEPYHFQLTLVLNGVHYAQMTR